MARHGESEPDICAICRDGLDPAHETVAKPGAATTYVQYIKCRHCSIHVHVRCFTYVAKGKSALVQVAPHLQSDSPDSAANVKRYFSYDIQCPSIMHPFMDTSKEAFVLEEAVHSVPVANHHWSRGRLLAVADAVSMLIIIGLTVFMAYGDYEATVLFHDGSHFVFDCLNIVPIVGWFVTLCVTCCRWYYDVDIAVSVLMPQKKSVYDFDGTVDVRQLCLDGGTRDEPRKPIKYHAFFASTLLAFALIGLEFFPITTRLFAVLSSVFECTNIDITWNDVSIAKVASMFNTPYVLMHILVSLSKRAITHILVRTLVVILGLYAMWVYCKKLYRLLLPSPHRHISVWRIILAARADVFA